MDTPILIFGTETKARIALEIFQRNNIMVYGLLDEKPPADREAVYSHVAVLSHIEDPVYLGILGDKCHPFLALQDPDICEKLALGLGKANKFVPVSAIHPMAEVSKEARIGAGCILNANTIIAANVNLHNHVTTMGQNIIGHDSTLHDFVTLSPGAIINSHVTIHPRVHIGSGAIINPHITIGENAKIAPGTIVTQDVPPAADNTSKP